MAVIHIPPHQSNGDIEDDLSSSRAMLAMMQKSLRDRWKIPDGARAGIYHYAASVISDEDKPTRSRLSAAKILISLDTLESTERRSCVELTLRHDISGLLGGDGGGLAHLQPPSETESWIDDTPVSSPVQHGEYNDA